MQGTRWDEPSGCFRGGIKLCCRKATGGGRACGSATCACCVTPGFDQEAPAACFDSNIFTM
jgi:hypothetical protein